MLNPPTPERIETAVHDTIRAVLAERFGEICTFGGTDKLNAKLGLSSLVTSCTICKASRTSSSGTGESAGSSWGHSIIRS